MALAVKAIFGLSAILTAFFLILSTTPAQADAPTPNSINKIGR